MPRQLSHGIQCTNAEIESTIWLYFGQSQLNWYAAKLNQQMWDTQGYIDQFVQEIAF